MRYIQIFLRCRTFSDSEWFYVPNELMSLAKMGMYVDLEKVLHDASWRSTPDGALTYAGPLSESALELLRVLPNGILTVKRAPRHLIYSADPTDFIGLIEFERTGELCTMAMLLRSELGFTYATGSIL